MRFSFAELYNKRELKSILGTECGWQRRRFTCNKFAQHKNDSVILVSVKRWHINVNMWPVFFFAKPYIKKKKKSSDADLYQLYFTVSFICFISIGVFNMSVLWWVSVLLSSFTWPECGCVVWVPVGRMSEHRDCATGELCVHSTADCMQISSEYRDR